MGALLLLLILSICVLLLAFAFWLTTRVINGVAYKMKLGKIPTIIICLLGVVGGLYYFVMVRTGLPSDEEMIAHFQEHKTEIEDLVRRYRAFERPYPGDTKISIPEWSKTLPRDAFDWEKQHADTSAY